MSSGSPRKNSLKKKSSARASPRASPHQASPNNVYINLDAFYDCELPNFSKNMNEMDANDLNEVYTLCQKYEGQFRQNTLVLQQFKNYLNLYIESFNKNPNPTLFNVNDLFSGSHFNNLRLIDYLKIDVLNMRTGKQEWKQTLRKCYEGIDDNNKKLLKMTEESKRVLDKLNAAFEKEYDS